MDVEKIRNTISALSSFETAGANHGIFWHSVLSTLEEVSVKNAKKSSGENLFRNVILEKYEAFALKDVPVRGSVENFDIVWNTDYQNVLITASKQELPDTVLAKLPTFMNNCDPMRLISFLLNVIWILHKRSKDSPDCYPEDRKPFGTTEVDCDEQLDILRTQMQREYEIMLEARSKASADIEIAERQRYDTEISNRKKDYDRLLTQREREQREMEEQNMYVKRGLDEKDNLIRELRLEVESLTKRETYHTNKEREFQEQLARGTQQLNQMEIRLAQCAARESEVERELATRAAAIISLTRERDDRMDEDRDHDAMLMKLTTTQKLLSERTELLEDTLTKQREQEKISLKDRTERAKYAEELVQLRIVKDNLERQSATLKGEIQSNAKGNSTLLIELQEARDTITKLEVENTQQTAAAKLRIEKQSHAQWQSFATEKEALKKTHADAIENNRKQHERALQSVKNELTESYKQRTNEASDTYERILKERQDDIDKANRNFRTREAEWDSKLVAANDRAKDLERMNNEQENDIRSLKKEAENNFELLSRINALEMELQGERIKSENAQSYLSQVSELKKRLDTLSAKHKSAMEINVTLSNDVVAHKGRLTSCSAKNVKLTNTVGELENKILTLEGDVQRERLRIESQMNEITEQKDNVNRLTNEIQKAIDKNIDLENAVQREKANARMRFAEFKNAKEENEAIKKQQRETDNEFRMFKIDAAEEKRIFEKEKVQWEIEKKQHKRDLNYEAERKKLFQKKKAELDIERLEIETAKEEVTKLKALLREKEALQSEAERKLSEKTTDAQKTDEEKRLERKDDVSSARDDKIENQMLAEVLSRRNIAHINEYCAGIMSTLTTHPSTLNVSQNTQLGGAVLNRMQALNIIEMIGALTCFMFHTCTYIASIGEQVFQLKPLRKFDHLIAVLSSADYYTADESFELLDEFPYLQLVRPKNLAYHKKARELEEEKLELAKRKAQQYSDELHKLGKGMHLKSNRLSELSEMTEKLKHYVDADSVWLADNTNFSEYNRLIATYEPNLALLMKNQNVKFTPTEFAVRLSVLNKDLVDIQDKLAQIFPHCDSSTGITEKYSKRKRKSSIAASGDAHIREIMEMN